jgi:hypothetical protein
MEPMERLVMRKKKKCPKLTKKIIAARDKSPEVERSDALAVLAKLSDKDLWKLLWDGTICATGLEPRAWQYDVPFATMRGIDCLMIAGTREGKTLTYVMPCFVCPNVTVVIVSPLNALEIDQVSGL